MKQQRRKLSAAAVVAAAVAAAVRKPSASLVEHSGVGFADCIFMSVVCGEEELKEWEMGGEGGLHEV